MKDEQFRHQESSTEQAASAGPLAVVIRTAGTNCDAEMVRAFELAGARTALVHVDTLAADPGLLDQAALLGLPGGFSYGDDIASGRILAARLRAKLWPQLRDAAARGCAMIGVCNGFQVLVQLGLLPGPADGQWPAEAPEPTVALADNAGGRFIDRWVDVEVADHSPCIWTAGLRNREGCSMPIAHGEGRFVADGPMLAALEAGGQVALRYAPGSNPNGSAGDIAGICDASGRIFGLMPHPERALDHTRDPAWTSAWTSALAGDRSSPPIGRAVFDGAVAAVRASQASSSQTVQNTQPA